MDRIDFTVEEVPETPLGDRQTVPYINGVRLTELIGAVFPPDEMEGREWRQYPEYNIGLEPADAFLPSRHYFEPSEESRVPGFTILLRCSCGDWMCTQVIAKVETSEREVVWSDIQRLPASVGTKAGPTRTFRPVADLHFDRAQYEAALREPAI